jgi:CheY-like chemotaxis protein
MSELPRPSPDPPASHQPLLLVVEDLSELRLLVNLTGKRGGLEVVSCPDVPTAWEALRQHRPDLVLLDLNLPGLNGLELYRRIRAAPEQQGLRVALFGNYDLTTDLAQAVEAGICFVVTKDLLGKPAEWLRRVREILALPDSHPPRGSLGCVGRDGNPPSTNWRTVLQQALRLGPVRRLGAAVLQIVLRRAQEDARACSPQAEGTAPGDAVRLEDPLPATTDPGTVVAFIVALADRIECLLGVQASQGFRALLATLVPALSEDLANE